jgi:hypothetical protein
MGEGESAMQKFVNSRPEMMRTGRVRVNKVGEVMFLCRRDHFMIAIGDQDIKADRAVGR